MRPRMITDRLIEKATTSSAATAAWALAWMPSLASVSTTLTIAAQALGLVFLAIQILLKLEEWRRRRASR